MHEPTPELLADVLGAVLQDSAFIFAEPMEEEPEWTPPVFAAEIGFESVRNGVLRLVTNPRGAVEVAANMLGVDPGDPEAEAQGRSALAEILNVVGGAFLNRFFGGKVPSQLGLPKTVVLSDLPATAAPCVATLQLESGDPVRIEIELEPAAA